MNPPINNLIAALNSLGVRFCDYSGSMFVQSGVLIVLLLFVDFLIRKHIRATLRYWIWMLVFVKLILPPSLSLPTGIGYWRGEILPVARSVSEQESAVIPFKSGESLALEVTPLPIEVTPNHPAQTTIEPIRPSVLIIPYLNALTRQTVVFILWFMGVLIFSVILIQRILYVRRLIAQSDLAENRFTQTLDQCRRQVGIHRSIGLRLSNDISSPAVCGFLKPVILMPTALIEKLTPDRFRSVLIHELCHIKRSDLWINAIQTVLQIVYFYNPLVWVVNVVVRRAREQAVDEMVLVTLGSGAKDYSNTLIDIAEMAVFKTSLSLRLIGVVESKKALEGRIKHMLNRPLPTNTKVGKFSIIFILVIAAVLLPMAKAQKKELGIVETKQIPDHFTATLPDDVVVELVGVCEHPSEGKQWWQPDGTPIETDDLPDYDYDDAVTVRENEYARLLAFKLDDKVVQGAGISWSLENSNESRFAPDYTDKTRTKRRSVQVILAAFPETLECANLRLGITAGHWKAVASGTDGTRGAQTLDSITQSDVIYHEAHEENGTTSISATHLLGPNYDCRIYARGKNGEIYEPRKYSNGGRQMRLCKSEFDIPLEKVKLFHLQARPFQWVTFENISLQRGLKTNVKMKMERPNIQTEESIQRRIILLPDVDHKPLMLDLTSGELLDIPKANTEEEIWSAIEKLGKGDVVYDASSLILVRGATTQSPTETITGPFKGCKIDQKLPVSLTITTKEGIDYAIKVQSADTKECGLEYYSLGKYDVQTKARRTFTEQEGNREDLIRRLTVLEHERDNLFEKINQYRQTIRELGQEFGDIDLERRQQMMLDRVAALMETLTKTEAERIKLETEIQMLEHTKEQPMDQEKLLELRQAYVNGDPSIKAYAENIVQLEREIIIARQTKAQTHPEIQQKTAQLEAMKERLAKLKRQVNTAFDEMSKKEATLASETLLASKQNELEQKKAFEKRLSETLSKQDSQAIELGRKQLTINDLTTELERTRKRYNAILNAIMETKSKIPATIQ